MSLATRCTSCGTIFRVVQDQLKVSEGWVRCGRCQNVFNALQSLFDLDREQPPPWPPVTAEPQTPTWAATQPLGAERPDASGSPGGTPRPAAAPRATMPPAASPASPRAEAPAHALVSAAARASQRSAGEPAAAATAPATNALLHTASREAEPPEDTEALSTQPEHPHPEYDEAESSGFPHARFNLDLVHEQSDAAAMAAAHGRAAVDEPAPLFIRQADRAARWRRPRVRATLGLLLVLLTAVLLGQIALQFRDPLAAAWPQARGALQAMCERLDCRIEPPRRLDSLTVDASGLTRTPTAGVYRLSVALHNHSHTIVMVPAVDLSLTDAQGQLFARRTLLPEELGVSQATVAPGGDLTLQAVLSTGAERVVGYTVEIFYP